MPNVITWLVCYLCSKPLICHVQYDNFRKFLSKIFNDKNPSRDSFCLNVSLVCRVTKILYFWLIWVNSMFCDLAWKTETLNNVVLQLIDMVKHHKPYEIDIIFIYLIFYANCLYEAFFFFFTHYFAKLVYICISLFVFYFFFKLETCKPKWISIGLLFLTNNCTQKCMLYL